MVTVPRRRRRRAVVLRHGGRDRKEVLVLRRRRPVQSQRRRRDAVKVAPVKDDDKMATSNEDFEDDLDWQKELEAELNAELGE